MKPHGFTLFCDDLREEKTGKTTYVGVYGDVMYIDGDLPSTLPGLHFAIHLFAAPHSTFETLKIQVAMPGDDIESPAVSFDVDRANLVTIPRLEIGDELTHPRSHITFKLGLVPFPIKGYGRIRVSALWNGEFVPLGSLAVAPPGPAQTPDI
jgi:hypothetical protein